MYDANDFIPDPNGRANVWIQVRRIPEQILDHGTKANPNIEIRPAMDVPTGEEICGKAGMTLKKLIAELNKDEVV